MRLHHRASLLQSVVRRFRHSLFDVVAHDILDFTLVCVGALCWYVTLVCVGALDESWHLVLAKARLLQRVLDRRRR